MVLSLDEKDLCNTTQGIKPKLNAHCKCASNIQSFWAETELGIYYSILQTGAEKELWVQSALAPREEFVSGPPLTAGCAQQCSLSCGVLVP